MPAAHECRRCRLSAAADAPTNDYFVRLASLTAEPYWLRRAVKGTLLFWALSPGKCDPKRRALLAVVAKWYLPRNERESLTTKLLIYLVQLGGLEPPTS
jgi:hypothetical protein